jgi:O-antigen chain-terminating methyltransferase
MLADCRALDLNVRTQDAISALQEMENESASIVSAFHLIEHIPFETLRLLVSEAYRVLKPGGLLIMETPNPENILVGSSNFYLDPTHTRPIPPGLLSFIPRYSGFFNVKVLRLQESPSLRNLESPKLLEVFGGASPDYAVIAQKSATHEVLDQFKAAFDLEIGLTLETLSNRYDQALKEQRNKLDALAHDIYHSTSWKITRPLRYIGYVLKACKQKIKGKG